MIRVYIFLALMAAAFGSGFWTAAQIYRVADKNAQIAALTADRERFKRTAAQTAAEAAEAIRITEQTRIETDALIEELRNAPAVETCRFTPSERDRVRKLFQAPAAISAPD